MAIGTEDEIGRAVSSGEMQLYRVRAVGKSQEAVASTIVRVGQRSVRAELEVLEIDQIVRIQTGDGAAERVRMVEDEGRRGNRARVSELAARFGLYELQRCVDLGRRRNQVFGYQRKTCES